LNRLPPGEAHFRIQSEQGAAEYWQTIGATPRAGCGACFEVRCWRAGAQLSHSQTELPRGELPLRAARHSCAPAHRAKLREIWLGTRIALTGQ